MGLKVVVGVVIVVAAVPLIALLLIRVGHQGGAVARRRAEWAHEHPPRRSTVAVAWILSLAMFAGVVWVIDRILGWL